MHRSAAVRRRSRSGQGQPVGQLPAAGRFPPLAEKLAPGSEFQKALIQLLFVHLHPGVEQLHLNLKRGAFKNGGGHVLGHAFAVQMVQHERAHRPAGGFKIRLPAVDVFGQRQQVGIKFPDPLHALVGHGQKKRRFAIRPGGRIRFFADEIKAQPVFKHHGLKNLPYGILKLFLLFRHHRPPLSVFSQCKRGSGPRQ